MIRVRQAVESDLPAMVRVNVDTRRACYRSFYPSPLLDGLSYERVEQAWMENLWKKPDPPGKFALVAETPEGEIIGIAIAGPNRERNTGFDAEIYVLYVLPAYQGQGAGTELMRTAAGRFWEQGRKTMLVWVLDENPSRHFYESRGGKLIGEKTLEMRGYTLKEVSYGWGDLKPLMNGVMEDKPRILRLIHWKPEEAAERANLLESLGYGVDFSPISPAGLKALRQSPPGAVIIDLSRLPSQGRDIAVQLRSFKSTRQAPIVFMGGDPEKTARVRELLPDAVFATWEEAGRVLEQTLSTSPPEGGYMASSAFAGYAGAPLNKKLGIRSGISIALWNAPEGFEAGLGELPPGTTLVRQSLQEDGHYDLTLWFVHSHQELEVGISRAYDHTGKNGLWIIWPKKTSGVISDVTEPLVRATGLAAGLVDYKIASIDDIWSGLRFTIRKTGRSK